MPCVPGYGKDTYSLISSQSLKIYNLNYLNNESDFNTIILYIHNLFFKNYLPPAP
jgi:hypothetical protein